MDNIINKKEYWNILRFQNETSSLDKYIYSYEPTIVGDSKRREDEQKKKKDNKNSLNVCYFLVQY